MVFLITTAGNALAGVSPHLDGQGGCSMACCQAARQNQPESSLSRLCCMMDCSQPAGATPSQAATVLAPMQHQVSLAAPLLFTLEAVLYLRQTRFPDSPTRSIAGSSTRYLETGAFLI